MSRPGPTSTTRWVTAAVAALALLASGCSGGDTADTDTDGGEATATDADLEPLRIGFLTTLSGALATNGEEGLRGLELYLEEQGEQFDGRPVELLVEDDESDPDIALRKLDRLINQEEVHVIVGGGSSAIALAIRDVVDEAGVPFVNIMAQSNELSHEQFSDYVFRTSHTYNQAGFAAGQWMADSIGTEDVHVITWDFVAGQDMADSFTAGFEDGGGEVAGYQFTPFLAVSDWQPYLTELRSADAQAVYAFYGGNDSVNFVSQWDAFGMADQAQLVGMTTLVDETIFDAIGSAAEGVITVASYTWTIDNPTNEAFASTFQDAYGSDPADYAVYTWDAGQLIQAAASAVNDAEVDRADLAAAMAEVRELDSPRGQITMNPETHNPDQPFYVVEVQDQDGDLNGVVLEELGMMEEQVVAEAIAD